MIIQDWFINSNFNEAERNALRSGYYISVVSSTEKALKCIIETDWGNIKRWIPKAAMTKLYNNKVSIDFNIGDVVKHKQFGKGEIAKIGDGTVWISFNCGLKHISNDVRYLEKVGV